MSQAVPARTTSARRSFLPSADPSGRRPSLRLVAGTSSPRRISTSVVCIAIVLLGLVGVLLLNIVISHTTFRIEELSATQESLHEKRDSLKEDISYRESPQNIAAAAEEQGMVRDPNPTFITSDGTVIPTGEVPSTASSEDPVTVPGPRADAREDVVPNLRSDEKIPAVSNSDGSGMTAPTITAPK